MKTISKIEVGDIVTVRGGFGTEPPIKVEVLDLGDKNGRYLFGYEDPKQGSRWAYFEQVVGFTGECYLRDDWED